MTLQGTVTQFALPVDRDNSAFAQGDSPGAITVGPDKALWFVKSHAIGRITAQGRVTDFPVSTENDSELDDITAGPDGALWFTVSSSDQMGRITVGGTITMFNEPTSYSEPGNANIIVTGPDGALWFTEFENNRIGRMQISQHS
jgi:virginiamycin B lyase